VVANDEERLVVAMSALLDDLEAYSWMSRADNPSGDRQASRRIAERLLSETVD
jgi:UDP-N-acetylglucosamine 2-epimerase